MNKPKTLSPNQEWHIEKVLANGCYIISRNNTYLMSIFSQDSIIITKDTLTFSEKYCNTYNTQNEEIRSITYPIAYSSLSEITDEDIILTANEHKQWETCWSEKKEIIANYILGTISLFNDAIDYNGNTEPYFILGVSTLTHQYETDLCTVAMGTGTKTDSDLDKLTDDKMLFWKDCLSLAERISILQHKENEKTIEEYLEYSKAFYTSACGKIREFILRKMKSGVFWEFNNMSNYVYRYALSKEDRVRDQELFRVFERHKKNHIIDPFKWDSAHLLSEDISQLFYECTQEYEDSLFCAKIADEEFKYSVFSFSKKRLNKWIESAPFTVFCEE